MESASAGVARARALAEAAPEQASLALSQAVATVRQLAQRGGAALAGLDLSREGLAALPSRVQAALGDLTPEQRQAAVSLGLVGLWAYGYLAHTRPPIESAAEAWARAHPPPYPVRCALSAPLAAPAPPLTAWCCAAPLPRAIRARRRGDRREAARRARKRRRCRAFHARREDPDDASAEAAVVATQAGAVAEGGGGDRDARLAGTDSQPADELEPRATAGLVKDIGMIYNR